MVFDNEKVRYGMKDIRYRAYRKQTEEIGEVLCINFEENESVYCKLYTSDREYFYTGWYDFDEVELMQYTGF